MARHNIQLAGATLAVVLGLTACGGGVGASSVSASCIPAHQFPTHTAGVLTVATYDLPPFSKLVGNDIQGVDGELVKEIARMECLTVNPLPSATAAIVPNIQAGRADVAVGDWYRTAARAEAVDLSDPLYTDQMGLISKDGLSVLADLKGKKVGTVDGYLWVADMKKYLGGDLTVYPTPLNMYQDLKAGRIQVSIDSFGSGKYNNKDLKVSVAAPDPAVAASQKGAQTAFPIPKNKPELLKAINEDIAAMHKSGKIAEILKNNGLDVSAADTGEPRLIN